MKGNDFLTYKDILADVLLNVGDTSFKRGISPGAYKRMIQIAMDEFAMATNFDNKLHCDKDLPSTLRVDLPGGLYDVDKVWVYNGSLENPSAQVPVMYKFGMSRSKGSDNYFANRTPNTANNEYFSSGPSSSGDNVYSGTTGTTNTVYYCSRQGDDLIFSTSCSSFSYVRIEYTGFGSKIDEIPLIPRIIRTAITDMATEMALKKLMAQNKDDKSLSDLYLIARNDANISVPTAKFRMNRLSTHQRQSMYEYFKGLSNIYG